jgi:hypothetical protein
VCVVDQVTTSIVVGGGGGHVKPCSNSD